MLKRAGGKCEGCQSSAPFRTTRDSPTSNHITSVGFRMAARTIRGGLSPPARTVTAVLITLKMLTTITSIWQTFVAQMEKDKTE